MSLFFKGRMASTEIPVVVPPDMDAALDAASNGCGAFEIAVAGQIDANRAEMLLRTVMEIEPQLLVLIANGTLATKTSAVDWVRDHTDKFPAAKFVQVMCDNAGGTWTKLVEKAPNECAGTTLPGG